ncbi:MAG: hypothetical protein ABSG97_09280 [Sedimentisphaerales bacterium]|jgi:hypothetical protein
MGNETLEDIPADWWKSEINAPKLNLWFKKHVIALHIGYLLKDKPYNFYASGFLFSYQKRFLWITAGHVIQDIEKLFQNNECDAKHIAWIDNNEINIASDCNTIPFDYSQTRKFYIDDKTMDLGVVRLEGLHLQTILSNHSNKWFTEENWRNNNLSNPEGFFLVGYPNETKVCKNVKKSDGNYSISKISCISNPVERIARKESDENEFWNYPDWFFGEALPITKDGCTKLNDIRGMSGGPILGIETTPDGKIIYRLFGIQSCWLPESKILRATPIENVIKLIDEAIK